jgi:hypothetical protein
LHIRRLQYQQNLYPLPTILLPCWLWFERPSVHHQLTQYPTLQYAIRGVSALALVAGVTVASAEGADEAYLQGIVDTLNQAQVPPATPLDSELHPAR